MSSRTTSPRTSKDHELVFSSRIIHPVLGYYERRYGRDELTRLVESLGEDLPSLEDPNRWISVDLARRLNRAMVERTGNHQLTYEAGLALADPQTLGPTYHIVRALGTPRMAYARLTEVAPRISKITRWEVVSLKRNRAVLRFEVMPGHVDDPLFCRNREGVLAGVPRLFDLPTAKVDHPRCIHRGDPVCEYHVQWMEPDLVLRGLGFLAGVVALAGLGLFATGGLTPGVGLGMAVIIASVAALGFFSLKRRIRKVLEATEGQLTTMRSEVEENFRRYQELQVLSRIDELTRQHLEVDSLIQTALEQINLTLGYDRVLFLEATDSGGLEFGHSVGLDQALADRLASTRWSSAFSDLLRDTSSALVRDVREFSSRLGPEGRALMDRLGTSGFVAASVEVRGEPKGILLADRLDPGNPVGDRDAQLLERVGHLLGLALSNARLVEDLKRKHRDLQTALMLNQKFSQYLPRPVVERLKEDPNTILKLGGTRIRAAVLFSDIAGFTPWAEAQAPEEVVAFLNRYFALMDEAIEQTQGILDKRMGDGLMVVFLAHKTSPPSIQDEEWSRTGTITPPPAVHPAHRAIECALRMQEAVERLNREGSGFERLMVRIGVAYGDLVAGNMGSMGHRLEYTVIGDVVNVASRLESNCPPGGIFVTQGALEQAAGAFVARSRGPLSVKGRRRPVDTCEVLGRADGLQEA